MCLILPVILCLLIVELRCNIHSYMLYTIYVSYNTCNTIPLIAELRCSIHSYMLYTIDVSYNTCNTIPLIVEL